jgi:hypothetical protein
MRKLARNSSDSLELLLDTVCSMFGAIVLIAILVALLAQTSKVEPSSVQASAEMTRRRIATAEADLAQVQALLAQLPKVKDDPTAALAMEKRQIEQLLAEARKRQVALGEQLQKQVAEQTVDFSAESQKLTIEQRALERRREELANARKTQDENRARLEGRLAEIDKLIHHENETRTVTLRFPKERARTKKSFPLILRYGKVYPLYDENLDRNEKSVTWKPAPGGSEFSSPIKNAGWEPTADRAAIQALAAKMKGDDRYLAFYVYPDSFDAFHQMRDFATANGWEFGLELVRAAEDLRWAAKGSAPPPL